MKPTLPPVPAALWMPPLVCLTAVLAANPPEPTSRRVLIDDSESYTNSTQLATIWHRPPHGAPLTQTLDPITKGGGKQGMRIAYATTSDPATHYAPICRVTKWDLSGCNAAQFWLKPDGSGRQLTFEFNIANNQGKNIHDLWSTKYIPAKGDAQPRLVTIPFASLVQNTKHANSPDVSPIFKPSAVIEVALYIGARPDAPGEGVYYLDEIVALHDPNLPKK